MVQTSKLSCENSCVPLDIFDYLHLPLPVRGVVVRTTPSILFFFFSFTKIALLYSGTVFTLKKTPKQFKCKCIKTSRWKTVTSGLSCGVDFGTSSYKRVKRTRDKRASSWHQQRLSSGSKEKTVPSKVSPILNPSCKDKAAVSGVNYTALDRRDVCVTFCKEELRGKGEWNS